MNATITNKKLQDTVVNVVANTSEDIEKMMFYLKFKVKENPRDDKYKKEFISVVIDVKKLLSGVYNNFISQTMMDIVKNSADFELKFPLKKVCKTKKIPNENERNFLKLSGFIQLPKFYNQR